MPPIIAPHSLFHTVTGRATVPHYSNFVTADFISRHCKGTTLYTKETPNQVGSLKNLLNRKIATKYKQEANEPAAIKKWRDIHKIWAAYKVKPRKELEANFRLKTEYLPSSSL
jgi:hypothetical protein